jgi:ornithine cyclodeaminase
MKILTINEITDLISIHGFDNYITDLIKALRRDYSRWDEFNKMPRPAMHVPGGVLELMPTCDDTYYSFKYVNCHPDNPSKGLATIVATGQLSRIDTGYPLMFSEMTLLTAFRTAATSALATDLMSRKNSKIMAIIGTGAQSEFQVRATRLIRDISEIRYFDIDSRAMDKFEKNMADSGVNLTRCKNAEETVKGADIITVCTACKKHVDVIKTGWIKPGVHINGLGGDCPGKTELELDILFRSRVVVEYLDQSIIEGEIQRLSKAEADKYVFCELHSLIDGSKPGRDSDQDITVFDSVGIALEDYSVLRQTFELCNKYNIGDELDITTSIDDPKNLISVIKV